MVQIKRVTKVVNGGKQLSFRAVVVVGNEKCQVGVGVASAIDVVGAVVSARNYAKRNQVDVAVTSYK